MKLGVDGTGMIANMICPHLAEWGIEVAAFSSTPHSADKAKALAEECGATQTYTDLADMLANESVDTVYIALPNFLHYSATRQALEAGKNVICEKPLTSNAREAQELSDLARSKGLYLWEAISTVYLPDYAKVREWLARIGQVKVVSLNYSQYSSRYDAFRNGTVLPAFDPAKSGGALMDLGLYNLHYALGLFGEPQAVRYEANIERDIDTSGVTTLDYGGFKVISVAAKDCGAPTQNVIQGTDGYILQTTPSNVCGTVTLHLNDGTEESYDANPELRWESEFRSFAADAAAEAEGLAHCYQMLDESLLVARVQTEARLGAGIRFPADR